MKKLFIVLAIMALFAGMAAAKLNVAAPTYEFQGPSRQNYLFWFDDMESGVNGWTTEDLTVGAMPHFHWDTYMAFAGQSWWCGNFDYDTDGGYGNGWDDKLALPEIWVNPVPVENVSWAALKAMYRDHPPGGRGGRTRDDVVPVLTFAYRHDSEIGYDFTYVQAESSGSYVNLNRGYDGVAPWTDIGLYGFDLSDYDDPLRVRFRFISDGAWSDEDGLYNSVGGGFAVDNVKVYDFATGDVLFYDSEPGVREGECIPVVPPVAGDYWHLIDRECPAYSDPHSWWCGDDADTSLLPPSLQNALYSPVITLSYAASCTIHFFLHSEVPTYQDDYYAYYGTVDGVEYYSFGGWWGDFGQCDGWGSTPLGAGFSLTQFTSPPIYSAGVMFIMYTSDDGCGPGTAGGAGIMIDDVWFEGMTYWNPVEESSWSSIKATYQ